MVERLLALTLVLVTLDARAENPKLAQARVEIDAVRYHLAKPLLEAAVREGTSSPAELAEAYRLLASTAVVLEHPGEAERLYRRWIALVPDASLPETVAPKLRAPFVAAQAYMAARSRLAAKAERRGEALDVEVSDPLEMAAGIAVELVAGRRDARLDRNHHAQVQLPAGSEITRLLILDEHGNRLIERPGTAIDVVALVPPPASTPQRTPFVRRPLVWAIPAAAFGAVGIGFGIAARRAQHDLDSILANSSSHFLGEAEAARDRRDHRAVFANLGFVAGGLCAATAIVMYVVSPRSGTAVTAAGDGAGVVVIRSF